MKRFPFCILMVFLISSCSGQPSEGAIQTALAKTLAAPSTSVSPSTDIPKLTIQSTQTTQPPIPTPDLRVIDKDIREFFLTDEEVSLIGLSYKIAKANLAEKPYTNNDLMAEKSYDADDAARIAAGRVLSWSRFFTDSKSIVKLQMGITLYNSSSGALLEVNDSFKGYSEMAWKLPPSKKALGDYAMVIVSKNNDRYDLGFSYRNIAVSIDLSSNDPEHIDKLARIVLDKLQKAPLVNLSESPTLSAPSQKPVAPKPTATRDTLTDIKKYGFYLVGKEIAPGVWRNLGDSKSCYWKITDKTGKIIDNYFGMAGGTMYIPTTAFQVQMEEECGFWMYIGK